MARPTKQQALDTERASLTREAAYEIDALTELLIKGVEMDWRAARGVASRVRKLSHAVMWLADLDIAGADMDRAREIVSGDKP